MNERTFAALVSAVVEAPIVAAFYPGRHVRMAFVAATATIATNVAMNVVLPRAVSSIAAFLIVGEGAAFAVEALVYAGAVRPRDIPRAVAASAFANAASFLVGWFV